MAFVNEYISEEDFDKFGLRELDFGVSPPAIPGAHVKSRHWTIDRERNIYLRKFSAGRDLEDSHLIGWTFCWKGELLWFVRTRIDRLVAENGQERVHTKIAHLHIPAHLELYQDEILRDIQEAFETYAGGGVLGAAPDYREQIDFCIE